MRTSSVFLIAAFTMVTSMAHAIDWRLAGFGHSSSTTTNDHPVIRPDSIDTDDFAPISADEGKLVINLLSTLYANPTKLHCSNGSVSYDKTAKLADLLDANAQFSRRLSYHSALKIEDQTKDTKLSTVVLFDKRGEHIIGVDVSIFSLTPVPEKTMIVGSTLDPKVVTTPESIAEKLTKQAKCDVIE